MVLFITILEGKLDFKILFYYFLQEKIIHNCYNIIIFIFILKKDLSFL